MATAIRRAVTRWASTNAFGSDLPSVVSKGGWDAAWRTGTTPWDAGKPAPVLSALLASEAPAVLGGPLPAGRALVAGAGSGQDALALAAAGRHVIALDISPTAVERARAAAEAHPTARNLIVPPQGTTVTTAATTASGMAARGSLRFVVADFFTWHAPPFDLAFDYTFLSCFPPAEWGRWAAGMRRLINDDG